MTLTPGKRHEIVNGVRKPIDPRFRIQPKKIAVRSIRSAPTPVLLETKKSAWQKFISFVKSFFKK